ncbi:GNAT family N-acetyltransferase [Paenibacillus sp. FA6]|uniref:GNAT family N-acetyltransferase n=1 Tax=Paenibacillus sp. FA6 TaxID=3413029 RepID=UPI003F65FB38
MTTQQTEIRSIVNRTELEAVYDILGNAFHVGRDFFQIRLDQDSTYDMSTTWIATQQNTITSTVQLFPIISRVDHAEVKIGGLGSVATVPEYQGQGQCRQILNTLTQWMEQEEYDLSLLYAVITPFYEKHGWNIVPEPLYNLNATSITASNDTHIEAIPFDSSYCDAVSDIYEHFNDSRTYTAIRSSAVWQDQLHWPRWKAAACLLAVRDGVIVAYGLISETKEGGIAHLEELCYLEGEENSAVPLFHALVQQRLDATSIQASLPDDHALVEAFIQWGAEKNTMNYAMWKVIRFHPLLAKLTSIFQKRLGNSPEYAQESLPLCLECVGQKAYIHYLNGEVSIESDARTGLEYTTIILSQENFISMLFQGYDGSSKEASLHSVLEVLFPNQNSVFYNMDKF